MFVVARWLVLLLTTLTCVAVPAQVVDMPPSVGVFAQQGFHRYDEPELGYSFRYQDADAKQRLDIYVYPVPTLLLEQAHEQRVQVLTAMARRDIESAIANGVYLSQIDLGVDGYEVDGQVVVKSRHGLRSARGEFYSVLYMSEAGGQAIKVRVSVPSTAYNAVSEDFEEAALLLLFHAMETLQAR